MSEILGKKRTTKQWFDNDFLKSIKKKYCQKGHAPKSIRKQQWKLQTYKNRDKDIDEKEEYQEQFIREIEENQKMNIAREYYRGVSEIKAGY